jgi:hypothetical protein
VQGVAENCRTELPHGFDRVGHLVRIETSVLVEKVVFLCQVQWTPLRLLDLPQLV